MRLNIILMIAAVLLTAGLTALLQDAPPPKLQPQPASMMAAHERSGQTAPDVTFTLRDGSEKRLHDLRGRVVIVNFWASWCVPCVVEYPQMLRMAAAMPDTLTLVAVSVDEDVKALERFIAKYSAGTDNVMIARDPARKIMQGQFQTVQLPESYLIGPDMVLRDKVIGASVEWDGPEVRARLDAYLNGTKR